MLLPVPRPPSRSSKPSYIHLSYLISTYLKFLSIFFNLVISMVSFFATKNENEKKKKKQALVSVSCDQCE